jgi:hypothetical protein
MRISVIMIRPLSGRLRDYQLVLVLVRGVFRIGRAASIGLYSGHGGCSGGGKGRWVNAVGVARRKEARVAC